MCDNGTKTVKFKLDFKAALQAHVERLGGLGFMKDLFHSTKDLDIKCTPVYVNITWGEEKIIQAQLCEGANVISQALIGLIKASDSIFAHDESTLPL